MKRKFSKILGVAVTLAMLGSLLVGAAPAFAATAITQPSVALTDDDISGMSDYTIQFNVNQALMNGDSTPVGDTVVDYITIRFPYGTKVPLGTSTDPWISGDVTIDSMQGWGGGINSNKSIAVADLTTTSPVASTSTGPKVKIKLSACNDIGEGATVRVKFNNLVVENPPAIGDYTLVIDTNTDTTDVTSAIYSLEAPTVSALPGIVQIYNPSGIMMDSNTGNTAISTMMLLAGQGWTIKIGPGTYPETLDTTADDQIIIATGTAAETILNAGIVVDQDGVKVTGLTIKNTPAGIAVTVTENDTVFTDCVFSRGGLSTNTTGMTLFDYNNANAAADTAPAGTITGCTFDSTYGAAQDIALNVVDVGQITGVQVGKLTISDCTFSLDETAAYAQDTALVSAAGTSATKAVTLSGCTISGASGIGANVIDGYTVIDGSTLSDLVQALEIGAGTTIVMNSTITGCGRALISGVVSAVPAINVASLGATAPTLTITNTVITACVDEMLEVDATTNTDDAKQVTLMFNDLSGNTKGIDNNDAVTTNLVNATVNWWGDPAGPASTFNSGVDETGYTGSVSGGAVTASATANALDARTTYGVVVTPTIGGAIWTAQVTPATGNAPVRASVIAASRYTANPQSATPVSALANGFYDVFFIDGNNPVQPAGVPVPVADQILIQLYNDAVTADTVAYVWSDLTGQWGLCSSQGVNTFNGFVWIKATAETDSIPTILDLKGTPFALCEPGAGALVPAAPALLMPVLGEREAPVKPTFTWTAVAGATGYEFVIAEELGQDDMFAIMDYSATTDINGHVARDTLSYDTVYNWRVRAVNDAGSGDWTPGFFTTIAEPEPEPEPVPPVVIKEVTLTPTTPEIILNIPPATKQEVQVIPDYLLWIVVVVGAVLIISVIVLIVRTRRIT